MPHQVAAVARALTNRPRFTHLGDLRSANTSPWPAATQVLHLPAHSRAMWLYDQRAIGRFLGNGIRPVMGSSSLTADARVLGARLKISSAAFW